MKKEPPLVKQTRKTTKKCYKKNPCKHKIFTDTKDFQLAMERAFLSSKETV